MIRIGMVGMGGVGNVHFNNYQLIDGCEVVAAVCHNEESREKVRKLNLTPYETVEAMVKSENLDIVDVCTPTYLHKKFVMEALNCGAHVIVEKPITLSKRDAEEMYALAKEKGKLLFVAQVVQFTKETDILREAVTSGKYGRPLDGYFLRIVGAPKWSTDGWLFDKNKSGLIPYDLHIHDLDLIVSLFGKPDSFHFTSSGRTEMDFKETYRFHYNYKSFHVTAEAAWYHANFPFRANWRVYFENGLLEYDSKNVVLYQPDHEPIIYYLEDEVSVATEINLPTSGMFYNELSHFIDCIKKGTPSEKVRMEQIIASVEILERVFEKD